MHRLQGGKRIAVLGAYESRGGSTDGLPGPITDVEGGVAMGFGDKRFQRGVGGGNKGWAGDGNLGDVLFQDWCALSRPEFDNGDGLVLAPTAERHLACGS